MRTGNDYHQYTEAELRLLEKASRVMERREVYVGSVFSGPDRVFEYLRLNMEPLQREEFWILWMDSQARLIEREVAFVGTINTTSVFPREIVKSGLRANAAAAIFAHNHPSGETKPSTADRRLTASLVSALSMVGIKVEDHVVIGRGRPHSFLMAGELCAR